MEITDAHIKIAKRELQRGKNIPGVAGTLMNHATQDAEFSDLIAIANRAQMQLESENTESNTGSPKDNSDEQSVSNSPDTGSSTPEFGDDNLFNKTTITSDENSAETESDDTVTETTDDDDQSSVPDIDEISDPDTDNGASSWNA